MRKFRLRLTGGRFSYLEWTAEVDFRASGQEHAGGNLQIWYIKENQQEIGSNSLYTVGKFEGLVLVVDGYGGERVRHETIIAFENETKSALGRRYTGLLK